MDICCGEVVVKSQIKTQSTSKSAKDNSNSQGNSSVTSAGDIHHLTENIEILQRQINELTRDLTDVSNRLPADFKRTLDITIKKQRKAKRL
jgi:predicted  nucleic acid-binding Zn-ribbon protein